MNWLLVTCVVAGAALAASETYTDRYDNINVDEIIENKKLLYPYLNCILDVGRCTPDGKELKLHIKEAIQTGCEKCTEKQKKGARKVVNHVKVNELHFWEQLKSKFDPGDKFQPTYEAFLARDD